MILTSVRENMLTWSPQKSVNLWGVKYITSLLSLTHKQWIYRNADVHHRIEGLTSSEHTELTSRIKELMSTIPKDLLPCHRHLLNQDFHHLGSTETLQRQIWVASMNLALGAASSVMIGQTDPRSIKIFNTLPGLLRPRHTSHSSQTTHRPRPHPPRRPQQNTVPASFWINKDKIRSPAVPPETHITDQSCTRYCLHWKRK